MPQRYNGRQLWNDDAVPPAYRMTTNYTEGYDMKLLLQHRSQKLGEEHMDLCHEEGCDKRI